MTCLQKSVCLEQVTSLQVPVMYIHIIYWFLVSSYNIAIEQSIQFISVIYLNLYPN